MLLLKGLCESPYAAQLGQIERHHLDIRACVLAPNIVAGCLAALDAPNSQYDPGAPGRQGTRRLIADTAVSPGDNHKLAVLLGYRVCCPSMWCHSILAYS